MESLIPTLNKLQQVSKAVGDGGFHLPRIVVVGSQGSGKSSVLENIVGRSFLPKGKSIVTRTPLVLNLVHSPREPGPHRRQEDGTLDAEEYGVFSHTENIFKDYDEICSEIQRQTESIAGKKKEISDEEITLNLYSPTFTNLTLVDLPGLSKFLNGEQPYGVETRIRKLVLKYVEYTDAIIMAVVPANTGMATNESLKLAKDSDPEGRRTLVVLTKVDLMDAGTDAMEDILMGNVIPVRLGTVAVVKDIADKKHIAQAIKDEAEFLRQQYPSLADKNGTPFLVATLKNLLLERIKDYLVEVSGRVELKIAQMEVVVEFLSEDYKERNRGWLKIINEFSSAFSEEIRESLSNLKRETREGETSIFQILHETFKNELKNIKARGPGIEERLNEGNFSVYMNKLIEDFKEPSLRCAQLVKKEMKELLKKCLSDRKLLIHKFTDKAQKVQMLLENLLDSQHRIVEFVIRDLIFFQSNYKSLFKRCFEVKQELTPQEFLGLAEKGRNVETFSTLRCFEIKEGLTPEEFLGLAEKGRNVETFSTLNFNNARKIVHDDVTARVTHYMVNEVKKYLQNGLFEDGLILARGPFLMNDYDAQQHSAQKESLESLRQTKNMICELNISIGDCGKPLHNVD